MLASISFTGTFVGVSIRDAVTGEIVLADVDVSTSSATISLAQAHSNNLNISLMYSE